MTTATDQWRNREMQLLEEKQQLHNELQGMVAANTSEVLKEKLKDTQETVLKLQLELSTSKSNNKELELNCERLRGDITRLEAEVENYRSQIEEFSKDSDNKSPSPGAALTATAALSAQLSDARNAISRKDAEIVRLNTALGTIRAELNKKQLTNSSIQSQQMETLNITVSQLQTALSLERDHIKELTREKDALVRETLDLKRQVRELELIVKRRQQQHSDSQIPFTHLGSSSDSRVRELERELSARQDALSALHAQLQNMQKKYEEHINDMESRLKLSQEDNQNLKATVIKLEENIAAASVAKTKKPLVPPPSVSVPAKEDAHLLATIRGLKQELTTKDKELSRVNKELDDAKKTNRRLQKEREKQLNTLPQHRPSSARGSSAVKEQEKIPTITESVEMSPHSSTKTYNPLLFTEIQETVSALRSENKDLKEEVKRLEEDLITMHGKRVHDLNALQNEHDLEVARLLNEHASRHAQTGVAELQGQLYTQQVVITHLKQQLKQVEEFKKEIGLLRAERDHLEQNLIAVKKKLSTVQTLQSPESCQYESVLSKLEALEQSHEIREQKLQSIVRDLLARSAQGGHCSSVCRDKLLDKNRQICYYRAEMDRILEVLRGFEFRRSK